MNRNHLAARLLRTFLGELEEQLRVMNAELLALESSPADRERLRAVFRAAHTLKGAARAAGVPLIEQTCHRLEAVLADARDGKTRLTPQLFEWLFVAVDALGEAGTRLGRGTSLAGAPLARLVDAPAAGTGAPGVTARTEEAPGATTEGPGGGDGQLRIQAGKLDALMAVTGELAVTKSRVTARAAAAQDLHDLAARSAALWRQGSRRIRLALERAGASPAKQALAVMEDSVQHLVGELGNLARAARADAHQLVRTAEEVQDRVRELRMRPFADACEMLPRAARDLAVAPGKEVEVRLIGGEVEADRAVLDGMRDALLQLVRNAVDHGIEAPPAREKAGKPRRGTIAVGATLQGDRIVVTVSDDGAGFDVPGIRAALARRGRPVPESDRDVVNALFESGVSTRPEASAVSGRGVGLDIVRDAVERIRGTLDVSWEPRRGTRFMIRCPPSLASVRAVLVAVGSQRVAIPTTHVERLVRIRADQIRLVEGQQVVTTPAGPVRLVALAALLSALSDRPVPDPLPGILLAAGSRRLALAVDELIAEEEVVLRPLRVKGGAGPYLSGGALLGSGQIALVLNPEALITAGLGAALEARVIPAPPESARPARARILVVDDSITTRTLEQSILEAAGYDVLTAVDGTEGWRVLQEQGCDLVVADIEMPRMDGFALCEAIRTSKRFKELPVILVTALETPEHHARGLEVGADAYIGKSSFDQQNLLDTIHQLLG